MRVTVQFFGELNDLLPTPVRDREQTIELVEPSSVKDFLEARGVPHPEIGAVRINGESVGLHRLVADGDRVEVIPCGPDGEGGAGCLPAGEPRFVLDVHLGTLAGYLRLLGFDTLYRNDAADPELARVSSEEGRVLLTRDVGLLKRSLVVYGRFVRAREPDVQLLEIVRRYRLRVFARPFTRCLRCNGLLAEVAKSEVSERLPEGVREGFERFKQCQTCGRVYWEGSHMGRMRVLVQRALKEDAVLKADTSEAPGRA